MKIHGISWAGAPTETFASTLDFFENVLGLHLARRMEKIDFAMFRLPSGQVFEIFGPKSKEHNFMKTPAIAFAVEDIEEAREELEGKGIHFVTEIETTPSGKNAWTYFVGPDGFLYELWQKEQVKPAA